MGGDAANIHTMNSRLIIQCHENVHTTGGWALTWMRRSLTHARDTERDTQMTRSKWMRNIEQVMQMRSARNKPPIQFQQTFSHPKWMYEQKTNSRISSCSYCCVHIYMLAVLIAVNVFYCPYSTAVGRTDANAMRYDAKRCARWMPKIKRTWKRNREHKSIKGMPKWIKMLKICLVLLLVFRHTAHYYIECRILLPKKIKTSQRQNSIQTWNKHNQVCNCL